MFLHVRRRPPLRLSCSARLPRQERDLFRRQNSLHPRLSRPNPRPSHASMNLFRSSSSLRPQGLRSPKGGGEGMLRGASHCWNRGAEARRIDNPRPNGTGPSFSLTTFRINTCKKPRGRGSQAWSIPHTNQAHSGIVFPEVRKELRTLPSKPSGCSTSSGQRIAPVLADRCLSSLDGGP